MSSITEYLKQILSARYGKDVRQSIHDSIKEIWNIATGAQSSATASANTAIAKASEAVTASKTAAAKAEEALDAAAEAKIHAGNAQAAANVKIATQDIAGLIKGGDNYIGEDGELHLTMRTTSPTLKHSKPGGIKLNGLYGASEQRTTTGAQLFDGTVLNAYVGGDNRTSVIGSANCRTAIVPCNANSTYTISKSVETSRFIIADYYADPSIGIKDVNLIIALEDDTPITEQTVTTSADAKYLLIYYTNSAEECDLMVNAGSTALPWEPYTGNAPSPSSEYQQRVKPVRGKNELDCRGLVEQTIYGVKITPVYDENGNLLYVEANGTASETVTFIVFTGTIKGNTILNGCPSGGDHSKFILRCVADGNMYDDTGNGIAINRNIEANTYIRIAPGYTADHLRFYPMIRPASIADPTYVPYGLLRIWGHGDNFINAKCLNTDKAPMNWLKAGTYTVSRDSSESYANWYFKASDKNYNTITTRALDIYDFMLNSDSEWWYGGATSSYCTFTIKEDCFVTIASLNANGTTYLMLVEGSEPAPYQPYTEQSITLSKPVELNGKGNVTDELVSGTKKFTKAVFDGSDDEGWYVNMTNTDGKQRWLCDYLKDIIKRPDNAEIANILCTHYSGETAHNTFKCKQGISVESTGYFYIYDEDFSKATLAEWKAHLAENPMTVVYELAEPVIEELPTADKIALNSFLSYEGTTHLYCDSEVQPTWDLEYGTSVAGGYALEAWCKENIHKINDELLKSAILSLGGNV